IHHLSLLTRPPNTLSLSLFTTRLPPRSTLFPYTTLFRSRRIRMPAAAEVRRLLLLLHHLEDVQVALDAGDERVVARLEGYPYIRSEEHSLNSSHRTISYAVFCLKKKKKKRSHC